MNVIVAVIILVGICWVIGGTINRIDRDTTKKYGPPTRLPDDGKPTRIDLQAVKRWFKR